MGKKLFDFAIGNPPYQSGDNESNSRQDPIYPIFYDAAKDLANSYILISPARFLFNAGLTSKSWNQKMLADPHIKVERYVPNGADVFPNTDIKGGVTIVYRDSQKDFGAIKKFIPDPNQRSIAHKVQKDHFESLSTIMHGGRSDLLLNHLAIQTFPQIITDRLKAIQKKNPKVKNLGPKEEFEIKSSSFDVTPYLFGEEKPINEHDYFKILGLKGMRRIWTWINKRYVIPRNPKDNNLNCYKVLIPKASGAGHYGETLSEPVIAGPDASSTPTFISIGKFPTLVEAESAKKYIYTKFARALLGILKITQDIVPSKWEYVPLQDFSSKSDIDWSKSIHDIDLQLYKKYGLSTDEIKFIESHVKEMA